MRNPKYHIYLTPDERRTVINSLSNILSDSNVCFESSKYFIAICKSPLSYKDLPYNHSTEAKDFVRCTELYIGLVFIIQIESEYDLLISLLITIVLRPV